MIHNDYRRNSVDRSQHSDDWGRRNSDARDSNRETQSRGWGRQEASARGERLGRSQQTSRDKRRVHYSDDRRDRSYERSDRHRRGYKRDEIETHSEDSEEDDDDEDDDESEYKESRRKKLAKFFRIKRPKSTKRERLESFDNNFENEKRYDDRDRRSYHRHERSLAEREEYTHNHSRANQYNHHHHHHHHHHKKRRSHQRGTQRLA